MLSRTNLAWLVFVAAMLLLARLETHSDDSGVVAFLILLSSFVLTSLEPRRARLWVVTGWIVPAVALLTGKAPPLLHQIPGVLVLLVFTTVLGAVGSYCALWFQRIAQSAPRV